MGAQTTALAEPAAPSVSTRDLTVTAEDDTPLAATLFESTGSSHPSAPLVVIGPGAAIPRRFYARFAAYVAERGAIALTFDHRAVGGSRQGSLVGSSVRMRDWCVLDVPGVIAWARRTCPERALHWVGHSMGGFATGLAHNNGQIARQLNVATLSGYWGRMASPERYRVLVLMGGLGALIVRACGYMPGRLIGGEDMPGPAFLEWRGWCMRPEFLFGDASLPERSNFHGLTAPLRAIQIADDPWGTHANVAHMTGHFTGSVERSIWPIAPAEVGVATIGHFGFFRHEMREALWRPAADWVLGDTGSDPMARPSPTA